MATFADASDMQRWCFDVSIKKIIDGNLEWLFG